MNLLSLLCFLPLVFSAVPPHPRLVMSPADFTRVNSYLQNDTTAKNYYTQIENQGTNYLSQPPVPRGTGGDQLNEAREVLKRLYIFGTLYRIQNDVKWANRGVEEMLSVGNWSDWNPDHFLDVAEMTHAFAIGYDWLYPAINSTSRTSIENAILILGLQAGITQYNANAWWWKDLYNWNIVCNGGLSIGALAIIDVGSAASTANQVLTFAKEGISISANSYAPDGAWPEGPMYWGYASRYLDVTIAALSTATNDTWGLDKISGVSDAVLFSIYSIGPTGLYFNWADCENSLGSVDIPPYLYFARYYNKPVYAYAGRSHITNSNVMAQDLCFYDSDGTSTDYTNLPHDKVYTSRHLGTFRQGWSSTSTHLSFKGGDNSYNHGHLDQGGFVFDYGSLRWSIDLGSDNYSLPGYWDTTSQRWTYYRLNTQGHNTLMFSGQNQDIKAISDVTLFNVTNPSTKFSKINMTTAYHNTSKSTERGFALVFDHKQLLVVDEFSSNASNATWTMHTMANISLVDSVTAKLSFANSTTSMVVKVLDSSSGGNCPNAKLTWEPVNLQPPQEPTTGVSKVIVTSVPADTCTRLIVTLGEVLQTVKVNPLADWNTKGPLA